MRGASSASCERSRTNNKYAIREAARRREGKVSQASTLEKDSLYQSQPLDFGSMDKNNFLEIDPRASAEDADGDEGGLFTPRERK